MNKGVNSTANGHGKKLLDQPVTLGNALGTRKDFDDGPAPSMWTRPKDEELVSCPYHHHTMLYNLINPFFPLQKVDSKKLERAEAKLLAKNQVKKEKTIANSGIVNATASQVLNKKDTRMEAKGTNNCKDIRIENFDISFGDR